MSLVQAVEEEKNLMLRRLFGRVLGWVAVLVVLVMTVLGAVPAAIEPDPEFWTSKQVCQFLGVPVSTLRYWQWQGTGPRYYRFGRQLKYRPSDVRDWAEAQANKPKPKR